MQKKIQLKNGYTFNRVINGCWQLSAVLFSPILKQSVSLQTE